jgi:predicted nicotinamide N-methyase
MPLQKLYPESYCFGGHAVSVLVPDRSEVVGWYKTAQQAGIAIDPYGTQVWPAAIGLCRFLSGQLDLINDKTILELAAGLGLPSLWAAAYAYTICCSDYLPEAVAITEKSKVLNGLLNLECRQLDWNHLPGELTPEVVLLSDINYEPSSFDQLFHVIEHFLSRGATVILSTPQRLSSKPFIDRLVPWCRQQKEESVDHAGKEIYITVMVLKAKSSR